MALLKILVAPDPRLKAVATPVAKVDAEIRKLMDDMLETMYAAPGIGLAATQIGVEKRVIVADVADTKNGESPQPYRMANPEIVERSTDCSIYEEGCLSLPDKFEEVTRPASIVVTYLDETNTPKKLSASGLLATCIQHEVDHLNGTLFVDHLSRLKRDMILRKLQKEKKQGKFDPARHAL